MEGATSSLAPRSVCDVCDAACLLAEEEAVERIVRMCMRRMKSLLPLEVGGGGGGGGGKKDRAEREVEEMWRKSYLKAVEASMVNNKLYPAGRLLWFLDEEGRWVKVA